MLSIKNYKENIRATTEAAFEKRVAKAIEDCGHSSFHMSHTDAGWPDRYIPGGLWIELKSIRYTRHVKMGQGLSAMQVRHMDELAKVGDKVWYLALLNHSEGGKRLLLRKWWHLTDKKEKIGWEDALRLPKYPEDLECLLKRFVL